MNAVFESDGDALNYLESKGYKVDKAFVVYHPDLEKHSETPMESEAITYLCQEWDYGWTDKPEKLTLNRQEVG